MNFKDVAFFVLGIFLGFLLSSSYWLDLKFRSGRHVSTLVLEDFTESEEISSMESLNLADELFESVKVLCLVMTYPANHQKKARHVMQTWGKRCNKLLFVSRQLDPDLPMILLDIPDGRDLLWDKTRDAFEYVHKHHLDDADWFMKADDDSYLVMENVRQLLYSYNTNRSLFFGHKFFVKDSFESGYMAGGGYILSKAAVTKLVEKILPNDESCRNGVDGIEDWGMGKCLTNHAIFVDCRDENKQQRFFPVGVESHFDKQRNKNFWYFRYLYYNVPQGNLDCCSEVNTQNHYIEPQEMYLLDYLIYKVTPFGVDRNANETLPRKLSFEEVYKAGKAKSFQKV